MHDSASLSITALGIVFDFDSFRHRPPHLMFARELEALATTTKDRMHKKTKNQES